MKSVLAVLAAVIIVAALLYLYQRPPGLSKDLYPLYNADWNAPNRQTLGDLGNMAPPVYGTGIATVPVANTMDPGAVFSPFQEYYQEKLIPLGWSVDDMLEAGGPMGGQRVYRKDKEMIVLRYSVNYHNVTNTAPSQCPCDVTLFLFSAQFK